MSYKPTSVINHSATHSGRRVLVTGATGYVGGRLVPELLAAGFTVRATSRSKDSLARFDWYDSVEAAEVDLQDEDSVRAACEDVDVLFYLVHSMGGDDQDFEEVEKTVATAVANAASDAGVSQIVYLSGLHPHDVPMEELSKHMRSRERVAQILLDSPTPAIVYRAATLIGSGSASFEIIRHLVERLPVMIAPAWITNKIEPISIRDTLYYLVRAADLDEPANRGYDIGCGKTYEFADLLRRYAAVRGLKRWITGVPLPLPMDKLSGMWIGLVTPVPTGLAIPLAQSMQEDAVTAEHDIADIIPDPKAGLSDYDTAVRRAIEKDTDGGVETSWDSSWELSSVPAASEEGDPAASRPNDPEWAGSDVYRDVRVRRTPVDIEHVWPVLEGIGGSTGWYSAPILWQIRGLMDKLVGGPGLGGRRDPRHLKLNDRVDWWRVEEIDRPHRLVLRAEMKISGKAWLVLELDDVTDEEGNRTEYTQTALYQPKGLLGRAYWWAVYPFHFFIFPLMTRNILKEAQALSER
ncbi:3 beta-hydroxysteroid dehydrogenase/Delta 5--_4-isomerase [Corynebacterium ciconiae DSM 44920]|uniref:SDR family oxidoreductase n=1 Tax=Corynebacterium ciconiae TaxID=227319 RepID=UPI000476EE67|nr:SDR family oxidoreductase [Corynebacterium ciconiae]WKD61726.1 3 beta-hydroxysteroid dehydrogenase/Delta 5-->4-isomerase [Corynebacterium ciconiae DSM 44920]